MTTHENAGEWEPPEGWVFRLQRHAAHACGWTAVTPWSDTPRFQAEVDAHAETCPYPDLPEPVETVSD